MRRALHPLALLLVAGLLPDAGWGCRFSVRETGFVDLGIERYFLFCYVDRNTPGEVISSYEKTAETALRDTRVAFETVLVDGPDDPPALKYLNRAETAELPALVLVSPREATRAVGLAQGFESALENVVSSRFRQTLVDQVARHYAVILLIEGTDSQANARAGQAASEAVEEIEARMEFLPKPVSHGPVVLRLKRVAAAGEELLRWSLGLEEETSAEPYAAVLYGRVRRVGPVLRGGEITREMLYNILTVVGADCECGIDPSLFRGAGLPVRWDQQTQVAVAADLGFDPENPMVKTEVSQIMRLRATLYPWAFSRREPSPEALDELPVPFVEDTVEREENPLLGSLLYTFAGLAGLALLGALYLALRAVRRES